MQPPDPAIARLEEFIRVILQRRHRECAEGHPGNDPTELMKVLDAFGRVVELERKKLVRLVRSRAVKAGRYGFEACDDVLSDACLRCCEELVQQYIGKPSSYAFVIDREVSIAGWVMIFIGHGFGEQGGVLGTYLYRERRDDARLVVASDEDSSGGLTEEAMRVSDGLDPLRQAEARGLLKTVLAAAESLPSAQRFAIETLLLFLGRDDDDTFFWNQVDALPREIWGGSPQADHAFSTAKKFREGSADRLAKSYVLEMIESVVGKCPRQISRWYKDFIEQFSSVELA